MTKMIQIRQITLHIFVSLVCIFLLSCNFSTEEPSTQEPIFTDVSEMDSIGLPSFYQNIKIDSLNNLALEFWRSGDYQKSLNLVNLAYSKAEKENNDAELAKILNTLGLVQWRLGNNEDALASYTESGNIAERLNMYRLLGLTHTNRALILKEQGNFESAFQHNNRAIELFKPQKEFRDLAIALNNQGQIFKNKKVNDSAKSYYLRALRNYEKVDYKDGEAATYYNLSDIYLREGEKILSLAAIQKSLDLSISINRKLRISEGYQKLSEVYETFQETDSALKYYKLYAKENNAILMANQSKTLAEYQARMGSEVKTLQIENLKKQQRLIKNRNWFIAIAILAILLSGGFFVYRYFQKIRFKKKSLELQLHNSNKILTIKEQELKTYILDLSKKNSIIDTLQKEIGENINHSKKDAEVANLLEQKILTDEDWTVFKSKFNNIYPNFFGKIQHYKISLTEGEIRYLVLLHLDLTSKEMSKILGISPQSVRVSKMRLKKKLNKEGYKTVEEFLKALMK